MKIFRHLSAWTAAVCTAVLLPLPCRAQETYSYTLLEDGTASLCCEDKAVIHAEIPDSIDGYTVTELAEGCFADCTALETVTIPDSVTTLRSYVFQNCVLLEEVGIPASVTQIEDFVFEGCVSLVEISVDEGNADYYDEEGILFSGGSSPMLMRYPAAKDGEAYSTPDNCATLAPWSFTDCRNLKKVTLTRVSAVGADAFMGCSKLQKAVLSDNITELIGAAFANCGELREVTLPEKLESIGDRCFFGCVKLNKITLPNSLKSIGERAFFGCTKLTELTLPGSVKDIGEYGVGYSVNSEGTPTVIPDLKVEVAFGSKGYKYARENGIRFRAEIPANMALLAIIGLMMVMLLVIGIMAERSRKKQEQLQAPDVPQERRKKSKQ